jgi:hypothetical protein
MKATKKELVTPIHEEWLTHNTNPTYSLKAVSFLGDQLTHKPRERKETFSASSIGRCRRAQQFSYLGVKPTSFTAKQVQILHNGMWMHLRWQMAGLTAGWLCEAEVLVPDNAAGLKGTMDGVLWGTHQVVEFKSINSHGFGIINSFGIDPVHNDQVHAYMYASDTDLAVVIYENKDTQDWKELLIERDEETVAEIVTRADELWIKTWSKELYEPKSKCIDKEGTEYTQCPFRKVCLDIHGKTEAELWEQQ